MKNLIYLEKETNIDNANLFKKHFDIKYNFNMYNSRRIENHALICIILEKETLFDYTDIEVFPTPYFYLQSFKHKDQIYRVLLESIKKYINITNKREIMIHTHNINTINILKNIGFEYQKNNIYKDMYQYNKEDVI